MDTNLLSIYRENPMQDGDVVLVVESHQLATEIEGLADHWAADLCRNLAHVLRQIEAKEVEVAVARPSAELHDSDHVLVADLREELIGSGIVVHPAIALPAAA